MSSTVSPRYLLTLLIAVNLLNYIDRQVLYAVFPLVKADLALSDAALGLLGSAFMVCYMVSAPVFGWIGDRTSRSRLAAGGLVAWSVATLLSGLASSYRTLLPARTLVGLGEASFGTVSPGFLSEFFPKEKRGRILSWFYLAIPVGSALGYLLGGLLGHRFGWQAAFLMVGAPGLLLAIPLSRVRDPRSQTPGGDAGKPAIRYRTLLANRSFLTNTAAMTAMTFALGGLAQWLPSFYCREHGLDVATANTWFGGITVVAGIAGTVAGGLLGDRLQKKTPRGYLLVSGWGFLLGTPFAAAAILAGDLRLSLAAAFLAEFFLFLNTGPLNTVIVNVTTAEIRSMAFAANIFVIHALGDAVSPALLGRLSDLYGLRRALLLTPAAVAIAGVFCFVCTRFIAGDMQEADSTGT